MADNILDEMLRREAQLQRFATYILREYIKPTSQDIGKQLAGMLTGYEDLGRAERQRLIADVKSFTRAEWSSIWAAFDVDINGVMQDEGEFLQELYQDYTPESETLIAPQSLPPADEIMSTQTKAGTWANYVAANLDSTVELVNAAVQGGIRDGQTTQQIISALRGPYNRSTRTYENGILTGKAVRHAEALARTGISHHTNGVRDRFADENKDVIQARIFFATLDSRTTSICLSNHLRKWAIDDDSYPRLPLHFNERSVYIFKTKGFNPLSDKRPAETGRGRDEADGFEVEFIKGTTTADQWLRRQPRWFVEETLGAKRAELFLDGDINIKSFVDATNRPLTLDQLRETTAGARAFRKAENDGQ